MYSSINELRNAWNKVTNTTNDALAWLKKNKDNSYVSSEYENCETRLFEILECSHRMSNSCKNINSVGIFGESQAGKSYLVSALISDQEGKSIIKLGDQELDFIRDINPQGDGKESTGVVTRFTTQPHEHDNPNQFEIVLLKEVEITKIIINTYYSNIKDTTTNLTESAEINKIKSEISHHDQLASPELELLDLISLERYIKRKYSFLCDKVATYEFWKFAKRYVVKASIEDRARFFSCLWGQNKLLTDLYIALVKDLKKLDYSDRAELAIDSIAQNRNQTSIINVDALNGLLNQDHPRELDIYIHSQARSIPLSSITALTAELIIPISNDQQKFEIINRKDILDFPGYRGRLNIKLEDLTNASIKELFLRGKVSYLFERYTDLLEMNCLLVCTSSSNQLNSADFPQVITEWIELTQGSEAQDRSSEQNGLFWALTQFDKKIDACMNNDRNMDFGENGLLQQTILEKFSRCSWLQNWHDNQPFNNVYLVRKPGIKNIVFDLDYEGREQKISHNAVDSIEQIKRSFVADPVVQRYINNPSKILDEVLKCNDGGLFNLCEQIEKFPSDARRISSMNNELQKIVEHVHELLSYFYTYDDQEKNKLTKTRKLNELWSFVKAHMELNFVQQFGFFVDQLNLPTRSFRDLVANGLNEIEHPTLDLEEEPITNNEASDLDFDFNLDFLDTDPNQKSEQTKTLGNMIYNKWCEHLRNLISQKSFLHYFGINANNLSTLVNELLDFSKTMKPSIAEILDQNTKYIIENENHRENSIMPISTLGSRILAEFITSFGGRIAPQGQNLDQNNLPILSENRDQKNNLYLKSWLGNLFEFAKTNISANLKVPADQNVALGEILNQYKNIYS